MSRTRAALNPKWINQSMLRQHVGPRGEAKKAFDDKEEASSFAVEMQSRPGASESRPYRAYRCKMCKRFHVGRKSA